MVSLTIDQDRVRSTQAETKRGISEIILLTSLTVYSTDLMRLQLDLYKILNFIGVGTLMVDLSEIRKNV